MILDRLENSELYFAMHQRFPAAFQFLRSGQLQKLADGEHELDGRRLYVSLATTPGREHAGTKLEAHRKYIDIHYVVRGSDEIGLKSVAECRQVESPYDDSGDWWQFLDRPTNWVSVPTGSFTIFYPDDGHAPLCTNQEVRKAVVKVQLAE